jgi:hypothetical protein
MKLPTSKPPGGVLRVGMVKERLDETGIDRGE